MVKKQNILTGNYGPVLIFVGFFIYFMIAPFVKNGIFFDGITYATIAKNFSEGLGTYWTPFYTPIVHPEFYEHPPLVFWIQSWFFTILGNGLWVERVFAFSVLIVVIGLMDKIWKLFYPNSDHYKYYVLVLFFFTLPIVNQTGYRDNNLDNTQTAFLLMATFFVLKCFIIKSTGFNRMLLILLAAFSTVGGFLAKGPVAFGVFAFPIAFYLVDSWMFRSNQILERKITFRESLKYTLLLFVFTLAILGVIMMFQTPRESIIRYLDSQVFGSLFGGRKGNNLNRIYFFRFFYIQTIVTILVFSGFVLILNFTRSFKPTLKEKYTSLLFITCFLIISLPVMLSQRVTHHYLLPSLPFLALGSATLLQSSIFKGYLNLVTQYGFIRKWLNLVGIVFILSSFIYIYHQWGTYVTEDVKEVVETANDLGETYKIFNEGVTVCPDTLQHYQFIAYAYRIHKIYLTDEKKTYYLFDQSCTIDKSQFELIKVYPKFELLKYR